MFGTHASTFSSTSLSSSSTRTVSAMPPPTTPPRTPSSPNFPLCQMTPISSPPRPRATPRVDRSLLRLVASSSHLPHRHPLLPVLRRHLRCRDRVRQAPRRLRCRGLPVPTPLSDRDLRRLRPLRASRPIIVCDQNLRNRLAQQELPSMLLRRLPLRPLHHQHRILPAQQQQLQTIHRQRQQRTLLLLLQQLLLLPLIQLLLHHLISNHCQLPLKWLNWSPILAIRPPPRRPCSPSKIC